MHGVVEVNITRRAQIAAYIHAGAVLAVFNESHVIMSATEGAWRIHWRIITPAYLGKQTDEKAAIAFQFENTALNVRKDFSSTVKQFNDMVDKKGSEAYKLFAKAVEDWLGTV